jgi:two-component system OmpR family response regulator
MTTKAQPVEGSLSGQRVSSLSSAPGVTVLDWPPAANDASHPGAAHELRLYLVAPEAEPPTALDERSDWLRVPVDLRDLQARVRNLQARCAEPVVPALDDDGILRVHQRWVALTPLEARFMTVFLEAPGTVVGRRDLIAAAWPDKSPTPGALDSCMRRLRDRVATVGLTVRTIYRRGFVLELDRHVGDHGWHQGR